MHSALLHPTFARQLQDDISPKSNNGFGPDACAGRRVSLLITLIMMAIPTGQQRCWPNPAAVFIPRDFQSGSLYAEQSTYYKNRAVINSHGAHDPETLRRPVALLWPVQS